MLNLPTHVWLRTPAYLFPELLGPWLAGLLFSVLLCSLLVPIRVLSLPRDPMTGSPSPSLALFLSKLGLRLVEYPKNYRSIEVQEVVFLPQFAAASRQRRFTALACFLFGFFLLL